MDGARAEGGSLWDVQGRVCELYGQQTRIGAKRIKANHSGVIEKMFPRMLSRSAIAAKQKHPSPLLPADVAHSGDAFEIIGAVAVPETRIFIADFVF